MKVVLFGATGMVGQGVLRECLLDPGVLQVLSVGRRATGKSDPKLHELVVEDLTNFTAVAERLTGYDACFFCLGITSAGTPEDQYRRITLDIPAAAGRVLAEKNPNLTFILVTGRGTDNTGKSSTMWARVKGEAENVVFGLPIKGRYAFRPAIIQPLHGVASRTALYRFFYVAFGWLFPIWRALSPDTLTTTERLGRAMLSVARQGYEKQVLETSDINAAAARS